MSWPKLPELSGLPPELCSEACSGVGNLAASQAPESCTVSLQAGTLSLIIVSGKSTMGHSPAGKQVRSIAGISEIGFRIQC